MLLSTYRAFGVVATPIVALALLASRRGRARFYERLGCWAKAGGKPWWFHAASVGEVQGISPVLRLLRSQRLADEILLSGTSVTGLDRGASLVNATHLAPIDVYPFVRRALRRAHPRALIISETELWPELLTQAVRARVPVSIINGRISDYTFTWYKRLRTLFSPLLSRCSVICVPDSEQRARYIEMGAPPARVHVTGHSKYDTEPKIQGEGSQKNVRATLFRDISPETRVLVLGSVRPSEETWWLAACNSAWQRNMDLRVVIAPRHMERLSHFVQALSEHHISFERRTELGDEAPATAKVLLLDTMGVLEEAYAAADLAFVGATLVDVGGHNPLEPAMYGVPVCVGPHIAVIRGIVREMRSEGGILEVSRPDEISGVVERLFVEPEAVRKIGLAGQRIWMRHRGSAERIVKYLLQASD